MGSSLPGYRIKEQIGTGAGSKIFAALELDTGTTVAVKHIARESSADDRFIAQAENEYEISSKLDHPILRRSRSIHRVRKLMQLRELFVVMDFVDGLSLEKARPNRLNTFLAIFQRIAQGLHAMHEAGYVHADIKPTNIMVSQGGGVKIIDFGQACPLHHRKERIQGTPDYIAPEQVRRMSLDRRTDVFNLGATMYWVLTSERYPTAIRGEAPRGGISLMSAENPLAPIELNDKLPLSLSKLVMECCQDDPHDRPLDMPQVDARLAAVRTIWSRTLKARRAKRDGSAPPGSQPKATDESVEEDL